MLLDSIQRVQKFVPMIYRLRSWCENIVKIQSSLLLMWDDENGFVFLYFLFFVLFGESFFFNFVFFFSLYFFFSPHDVKVRADVVGVPVKGYAAVDTLSDDAQQTTLEFSHVDTIIDATESEEVGVEHLLRDINDPSVSSLAGKYE